MDRIIFVDRDATVRAPMACGILKELLGDDDSIEVMARGIVVLFPEPINQKAEAVLASNGIHLEDYVSVALSPEDIRKDTVVLLIEPSDRDKAISMVGDENAFRVRSLGEICNEELPIMDPYGGVVGTYGLCFETLQNTIRKLLDIIWADTVLIREMGETTGEEENINEREED